MKKLLLALCLVSNCVWADATGILNKAMKAGEISRHDARALYLMKTRHWPDGSQIVIFEMPHTTPVHRAFIRDVLQMSPTQFTREWDRLVNAGLSSSIRFVTTSQDMYSRVAATPNGLGYVDSDYLIVNSGGREVKVLQITDK